MTKNITEITFPEHLAAIVSYLEEDAPSTKAGAHKLARRVLPALAELADWITELGEAVDEATNSVEESAEADADEREDAYGTAVENLDSVLMVLERTGWERPEPQA